MKIPHKSKTALVLIMIVIFLWIFCPYAIKAEEEREEGYYIVYEEGTKNKIFSTARVLHTGDQYLNEENMLYEIIKISDDKAYAIFKEKVDIQKTLDSLHIQSIAQAFEDDNTLGAPETKKERVIAIYHTHSDESYIPTDGKSSIPKNGGVFKVGTALKSALEEKGIKVIQSLQPHCPHDSMAYQRSRRTATELLKNAPDALIDIHRDAVPVEEYQGNVNGRPLAKTQLVVGRQNPQMNTVNNFAQQLKAIADNKYPGLVKGIFYGKGGYNQDIYPRSILIEAGTYTNSRYKAQDGVNIMADVIATTLYGDDYEKDIASEGGGTTKIPGERSSVFKTLLWIVGITILGYVTYLLLSTGSIDELSAKIKHFFSREFTNFSGRKKQNNSIDHDARDEKKKRK